MGRGVFFVLFCFVSFCFVWKNSDHWKLLNNVEYRSFA